MANRSAFLLRPTLFSLLAIVCLVVPAAAQHGGGGGHFGGGGGHSGGGHFGGHSSSHASSAHSGGHWGWLHFWNRGASRNGGLDGRASDFRTALGGRTLPTRATPFSYIHSLPPEATRSPQFARFSTSSRFHHHPGFFLNSFRRFHYSDCSFYGFNRVCYFQPTWPLFFFGSGFDWYLFNFGYYDNGYDDTAMGAADDSFAGGVMPITNPDENESPTQNSVADNGQEIRGQNLDPRYYLLILKNGTEHDVTDYWLSDGYIEYVSRDGTQSHIPVDALDLQETVRNNAARGLSFVLRSAP